MWDALSGANPELKVMSGHIDSVTSVAFSSDSTYIVSGSRDKFIQVPPFSSAWTHTQEKWIITLIGRNRLMWMPHDTTIPVFFPYTKLIISQYGSISIDFQHCKIGHDWAGCYIPT